MSLVYRTWMQTKMSLSFFFFCPFKEEEDLELEEEGLFVEVLQRRQILRLAGGSGVRHMLEVGRRADLGARHGAGGEPGRLWLLMGEEAVARVSETETVFPTFMSPMGPVRPLPGRVRPRYAARAPNAAWRRCFASMPGSVPRSAPSRHDKQTKQQGAKGSPNGDCSRQQHTAPGAGHAGKEAPTCVQRGKPGETLPTTTVEEGVEAERIFFFLRLLSPLLARVFFLFVWLSSSSRALRRQDPRSRWPRRCRHR
jgi:hypothetical protein